MSRVLTLLAKRDEFVKGCGPQEGMAATLQKREDKGKKDQQKRLVKQMKKLKLAECAEKPPPPVRRKVGEMPRGEKRLVRQLQVAGKKFVPPPDSPAGSAKSNHGSAKSNHGSAKSNHGSARSNKSGTSNQGSARSNVSSQGSARSNASNKGSARSNKGSAEKMDKLIQKLKESYAAEEGKKRHTKRTKPK